jgi:hypothetical protein
VKRLVELITAFIAGAYGTLLFFDLGDPPIYPEIHAYRRIAGLLWLAAFLAWLVIQTIERRKAPHG